MTGKYRGVKSRILQKNPAAVFSPCSAHTLNLCGVHSMETSVEIKTYFGNIQKLYNIFLSSPARWKILKETAEVSLHSVSTTRWSARIDAVKPLIKNSVGTLESLFKIEEMNLTSEVQAEVSGLIAWLQSFEFIFLTTVWYKILQAINDRNILIQSNKITLEEARDSVKDLINDVQLIRSSWDEL